MTKTFTPSLTLSLALSALLHTTQARYLWHPDEQPPTFIHNFAPSEKGEHHILNLAAAPEPAFHNSVTKVEASTSKHLSSVTLPTHTASIDVKPSPETNKPSPSSKDSKPLAATHPASAKPAASSKGPDISSSSPTSTSVDRSVPGLSSSASTPSPSSSNDTGGSSSGAVAGIVIAVIAIIGAITAFVMIRRKKRTTRHRSPDPFTMGFGSHDPPPPTTYSPPPPEPTYNAQPYYQNPVQMSPISPAYAPPYVPPPQETTGSLGVFNVVSVYTPTLSDEIDIQLGDHIELVVEYDDGWCQGINLSRGNAKGVFPRHCVEQYPGHHYDGPVMKRVSSMYMS